VQEYPHVQRWTDAIAQAPRGAARAPKSIARLASSQINCTSVMTPAISKQRRKTSLKPANNSRRMIPPVRSTRPEDVGFHRQHAIRSCRPSDDIDGVPQTSLRPDRDQPEAKKCSSVGCARSACGAPRPIILELPLRSLACTCRRIQAVEFESVSRVVRIGLSNLAQIVREAAGNP